MLLNIHPDNPQPNKIAEAVKVLNKGGLIIYPTDTIYAIGASSKSSRALENLARFKKVKLEKANFSFVFKDLSHLSEYTRQFDTSIYKLLKKTLPGPYTYILEANNSIGKIFRNKKRSIGIRIPDNNIVQELVNELGHPMISTSLHLEDEILEYPTDPELIYEEYMNQVNAVINGGYGGNIASTIIDLTSGIPEVIRNGKGQYFSD